MTGSGWLIGVDAGGSNTRVLAYHAASGEHRRAQGEGANWTVHGPLICQERIGGLVSRALPPQTFVPDALCLGVAGYYPPDHRRDAERWLAERWPVSRTTILPDVAIAWAGAFGCEPGVVVIAGTGSIVYGRNSHGDEARAGGWGPLIGDEGSAYWLARLALRDLSRMADGTEDAEHLWDDSTLPDRFLARWPELGDDVRAWLRGLYRHQWNREQIAELASEVVRAEEAGDPHARSLLAMAARELADQVRAVEYALDEPELPLAVQGGLANSSLFIQSELRRTITRNHNVMLTVPTRFSPLAGAVLMAAEAVGGAEYRRVVGEGLSGLAEGLA